MMTKNYSINSIFFSLILLVLCFGIQSFAECTRLAKRIGQINFQIVPSSQTGECLYLISPFITQNLNYRSYTLSQDGNLYVFSSYGPGPNSSMTGAREFYFFPRRQALQYQANDLTQKLEILNTNGDTLSFDYQTAQLSSSTLGLSASEELPRKGDSGGMNFTQYQGLILDAGFAMGNAPTLNPRGTSIFSDKSGIQCALSNAVLFQYSETGTEDGVFQMSDSELKNFLSKKCPQLTVAWD